MFCSIVGSIAHVAGAGFGPQPPSTCILPIDLRHVQVRASPSGTRGASSTTSYAGDDVLEAFATMNATNVYPKALLHFLHHQATWKFSFYPAEHYSAGTVVHTVLQLYSSSSDATWTERQQCSDLSSSSSSDDHNLPLARIVCELSGEKSASFSNSLCNICSPPYSSHSSSCCAFGPPCRHLSSRFCFFFCL